MSRTRREVRTHLVALVADLAGSLDSRVSMISSREVEVVARKDLETFSKNSKSSSVVVLRVNAVNVAASVPSKAETSSYSAR